MFKILSNFEGWTKVKLLIKKKGYIVSSTWQNALFHFLMKSHTQWNLHITYIYGTYVRCREMSAAFVFIKK